MASGGTTQNQRMVESIIGRDKHKLAVAAIDFGTTYSGYAFALRSDYVKDPMCITGNQWATGNNVGVSLKTSTCALFAPDGTFDSFGFEAEDTYASLAVDNAHQDWYYFRRFKMSLYNIDRVTRETNLEDDKGKLMPAMKVFSAVIRYLKDHLLDSFRERRIINSEGIQESEIYWVLTVPAIWSDPAKQFMREAAEKAGIPSDRLDLSLEPEAASIYCKYIPVSRREHDESSDKDPGIEAVAVGTKYLVLDAGGGTVDITGQEVQEDGSLKQIYMANGGDWGGTKVDEAYEEFLVSLVTRTVFEKFKSEHRDDFLQLFREFEIKKRTITPDLAYKVTFRIPMALNDVYQESKGQSLKDSFSSAAQKGRNMAWIGDKLRVDPLEAKGLFKATCDAIINHMEKILEDEDSAGTSVILMVGGFSESEMLRHAVKSKFGDRMKVIIPHNAGLSVLKGAVLYGFDTNVISTRVCKRTYGIQVNEKFREGKDPIASKCVIDGTTYCSDKFSKHVSIGQRVTLGELTDGKPYSPTSKNDKHVTLSLYTSAECDPEFCTECGCKFIGNLNVDVPTELPYDDRGIVARLKFGGTEISVEAQIKKTGKKTSAKFDLLS